MAWFKKNKLSTHIYVSCAGCGRKLLPDFNMNKSSPGYTPEKIHKTVDRNPPYYSLICPNCGHWTIRAPL